MLKRDRELMLFNLDTHEHSFKGLGLFLFIYIGASLFAAIFTAPAYWAVQWLDGVNSTETTRWLLGKSIDVYYDRLRWFPIILGLPWMMKECKLFSIKNLGLGINFAALKTFFKYFLIGFCLAAFIFTIQFFTANVSLKESLTLGVFVNRLGSAILSGLILGFLEELVFRGLIFRSAYTAFGTVSAMTLTSLFFAYKHFKVPNSIWDSIPGGIHSSAWDVGFYVAYYDTIGISHDFSLIPFLSLFMFGMVLTMIYIRTKVLWGPVAMHAGIVVAIQTYRGAFSIGDSPNIVYVGGAGMTNGVLALVLLCAIFVWLAFFYKGKTE